MFPDDTKRDMGFWNLWENNRKLFFNKCLKLMNGNVCEAEDALGAAMLKAHEKMVHCGCRIENFTGWALRLTENVCFDQMRKHRRLIRYDEIPEVLFRGELDRGYFLLESTEQYCSREVLLSGIFEVINALPRRLRDPALLRFLFFKSYREIAGRLSITEENARKRLQEARSALKQEYGEKIIDLFRSFPDDAGMKTESMVMENIRAVARSALEYGASEVLISHKTAWLVNTPDTTGRNSGILFFLPIDSFRNKKGLKSFLKYITSHPGGWKKHLKLAQMLCVAGMWRQAEKYCRHVLKKQPRSFSARLFLGVMFMETGRLEESANLFRQARSLVSLDSSKEYLLGMEAMCHGNYSGAAGSFGRAREIEPHNITFRHAMGICMFKAGHHGDVLRYFGNILEENPGDLASLAYCCESSRALGRLESARNYVDAILAGNPHDFFALTRKAGMSGIGAQERRRLGNAKECLAFLAEIPGGPEIDEFTDWDPAESPCGNFERKGGEKNGLSTGHLS